MQSVGDVDPSRVSERSVAATPSTVSGMSLRILPDGLATKIQFVLPDDIHDGPVSAVGTFNDWTPGAHKLVRRRNGTRSVTVAVPKGQQVQFRYLGAGGVWFDDEDADVITAEGSLVSA